jgi:hypothetical protein
VGSKNRLFSKFIRQINEDLSLQTAAIAPTLGLEEDAKTVDSAISSVLTSVSSDILPDSTGDVALGSPRNPFDALYLADSSTIFIGDAEFSSKDILPFNLDISPEILEIQADAPDSGHGHRWLWTWEQSTLPYARTTITNSPQLSVPLYEQGTYTVNNFAASIHANMSQTHSLYLKWIDGAGTDNNIDWVTYSTVQDAHPDIDSGNTHTIQRLEFQVPSSIVPPTLTAPSVGYDVVFQNTGAYTFVGDGAITGAAHGDNPALGPWRRGGTYTFSIDATGHPLYLTTDNGTNFSAGTYFGEYTNGVTGSRTESGTLQITVPNDAPDTLYYQCGNHSSMRGVITVKDLEVERNVNGNYVVYFQHTQEGHKQSVELKPIPSLVNQMCIVYDNASEKFVPQDLATYVDNTPSFKEKIKEVAGTATLVAPDGVPVVATVTIVSDASYLPLVNNNNGDLAYAEDTQTMYVWSTTQWLPTKPPAESLYLQLNQDGLLEVTEGTTRWTAPKDILISSVKAILGTAPSGNNMTASLNKNGSSINTITVSDGNTTAINNNLALSVSSGDYLTVDIDSAGGSDLNLIIEYI